MEVPVINRIRDFEVGLNSINDPSSFLSRSVAVSGIGKLHQAYGFWKWGALIIAFLAYFTNFVTKFNSLVFRLRKLDVSATLSSPTLFDEFDSDSDESVSSPESSDDEIEEDEEEEDSVISRRLVNGVFRVKRSDYYTLDDNNQGQNGNFTSQGQNGNVRTSCSFGDLFSWPDLGGIGSSGVVKLWDHLDFNDGEDDDRNNVVASSSVFLSAEKNGVDGVKVKACDPRAGFRIPALLAEWKQPEKLLGNIIGINVGGVEKIYVRDDVSGEIAVGDLRKFNGALTDVTESESEIWWDADVVDETR